MVQAWSIGTSQRGGTTRDNVPGSGAYNPNKSQKFKAPQWKIGTSQRGSLKLNDAPGPGSYNIKPVTGNESIKYTMRPKTGLKQENENTPGSGTYDPKIYSQYKKPVAFTMGMKTSMSESKFFVPGPGQYNSKSSVDNRPSYKFGRDTNRNFYNSSNSPGPGAYRQDLRPNSASAPKYGFGTSNRDGFRGNEAPGPGQYESKGALDSYYSRTSQGATIISRRQNGLDNELSKVPGPGAYEPKLSTKKSTPAFKIGTSLRDQLNRSATNIPGAGTYNLGWTDRPKSPAFKIGSDTRKPLNGFVYTPGPGAYNLPQRGVEGPQLSFKGVPDKDPVQRERERVPGSGAYNPSIEYVKQRPTSAKIGTAPQRSFFQDSKTPGPGNYQLRKNELDSYPKWGFGHEIQRPSSSKAFVPGPGAYNLKPTFADVPKYLIPHPESSKYL